MQGVGEEVEPAGGHHAGIELPQGARTGVAGVGKAGLAFGLPLGIDHGKALIGDQGFTTHLQPGRRVLHLQAQRHRGNGAHVGGDLLAFLAIAAGGGPHQHPVFVTERQRVAVDLELAHHRQGGAGIAIEHFQQPAVPGLEFFGVEGVVEAEQADAMAHARESLGRCTAHPLGGTVGGDQLGVRLLQLEQFAIEAVVNRILHLGCIEHVVSVRGAVEQMPQLGGTGVGGAHGGWIRRWLSGCGPHASRLPPSQR